MWFTSLKLYRFSQAMPFTLEELTAGLNNRPARPCGTQKGPSNRCRPHKGGGGRIRQLPLSEWLENIERHALKTFEGTREVQLCKPFDAPQFAEEFIALLRKRGNCRNLHIRARAPAKDASGNPIRNKKTGAPKLEWKDWNAQEKRKVG